MKMEEWRTHLGAPLARPSVKHRSSVVASSSMMKSSDVQELNLHFYTEMCVWADELGNLCVYSADSV